MNKRSWIAIAGLILVLSLVASACGANPTATSAPTATPTAKTQVGTSPTPTAQPTSTTAPPSTPTPAPKPTTLKVSSFVAPTHALNTTVLNPWMKEMEQKSGGLLKFETYYGPTLGQPKDHLDMVKTGIADMVIFCPSYTPGRLALYTVGELPLGRPSAAAHVDVMYKLTQKPYMQAMFTKENTHYIWPSGPAANLLLTRTKQVKTLEDIAGMKIRSSGGVVTEVLKALGAEPVTMDAGEMYTSLERGILDGVSLAYGSAIQYKLEELVKYSTVVDLGGSACQWIMNLDTWNKLAPDMQKLINDSVPLQLKRQGDVYDGEEVRGGDLMKGKGMVEYKLPPAELARWEAKVKPLWDKWVKDQDAKGYSSAQQTLDDWRALLKPWQQ